MDVTFPRSRIAAILEREVARRNDAEGHGGIESLIDEVTTATGLKRDTVGRMIYRMRVGKVRRRNGSEYVQEAVLFDSVDTVLQALDLTALWQTELADLVPDPEPVSDAEHDATCAACGRHIDWTRGDSGVRLELRRPHKWPLWWSLCALCACEALPLPRPRPDATGSFNRKLPPMIVRAAYSVYIRKQAGVGVIARTLWKSYGFATQAACAQAITALWQEAGWPMRSRSESKVLNTAHGYRRPAASTTMSDDELRQAYLLHTQADQSVRSIARQMYERLGYRTPGACAMAITTGWKRLGMQARDRLEMSVAASTTNGLSPNDSAERRRRRREAGLTGHGKPRQPQCEGEKARGGGRCTAPSQFGSRYCYGHDPERAQQRIEARSRLSRTSENLTPA